MICPVCNQTMEEGEVNLKKYLGNAFAFGWGSTNLVFKSATSGRQTELLNSWDYSKAYHCRSCGAALMATKTGER